MLWLMENSVSRTALRLHPGGRRPARKTKEAADGRNHRRHVRNGSRPRGHPNGEDKATQQTPCWEDARKKKERDPLFSTAANQIKHCLYSKLSTFCVPPPH